VIHDCPEVPQSFTELAHISTSADVPSKSTLTVVPELLPEIEAPPDAIVQSYDVAPETGEIEYETPY